MLQNKTKVFVLTFFGYLMAYSGRSVWSYSKNYQQKSLHLNKSDIAIADVLFLICQSLGFTFLGPIGQRVSKKWFLIAGYLLCIFSFMLIPLIYQYSYTQSGAILIICMGLNGIGQSVGLPGSLTLLSLYYNKNKKTIISIWAICTNFGKIFGLISSTIIINYLHQTWEAVYYFSAALFLLILIAFTVFLDKNQPIQQQDQQSNQITEEINHNNEVTYFNAFCLPRVIEYCIALCCVKGSTFSLLFWLPKYLQQNGMIEQSGYIPSMLEVGSIFGSILIGYLGDKFIISFFIVPSLYISTFILLIPRFLLNSNPLPYYFVMFVLGIFLGGVYNILITTMCVQLGSQDCIRSNKKAISTVTGVIDGVAALFTAVTQLILGYSSQNLIFVLISVYCVLGAFSLSPIMYRDIQFYRNQSQNKAV